MLVRFRPALILGDAVGCNQNKLAVFQWRLFVLKRIFCLKWKILWAQKN